MASFVLSFFPLDVLDGIWYLIESVSEGFLTLLFSNTSKTVLHMRWRPSKRARQPQLRLKINVDSLISVSLD